MRPWPAVLAMIVAHASHAAELLDKFRPSTLLSKHGAVSDVEFSTPLIELEPDVLAHHMPRAMLHFRFAEPVWVIAYETAILDAHGRTPKENHLCHTFFGDQRVMQSEDQQIRGLYSDAYTPRMVLPEGYAVPMAAEETLHWMPMFNNRGADPFRVRMSVKLSVIRDKDVKIPLRTLYGTLRSVQVPHIYFVKPGRDERHADFELPFNGRIHFMGTHLHPYGASVSLDNLSAGAHVWTGKRKGDLSSPMDTYSNSSGYRVRAGERYRVSAVYENPLKSPIDAMAGVYLLYSIQDQ